MQRNPQSIHKFLDSVENELHEITKGRNVEQEATMPHRGVPSWLNRIKDPAKRAAYVRALELQETNRILERQRGISPYHYLPRPQEPTGDEMEQYRLGLLSPSERAARLRGWRDQDS